MNMLQHLMKTSGRYKMSHPTGGKATFWKSLRNLRESKNYRGIMLLLTSGNMFNRILLQRLQKGLDEMLRENKAGFRENRSCGDQITNLKNFIEKSPEWCSSVDVSIIDFEKASDSVDREMLWMLWPMFSRELKGLNKAFKFPTAYYVMFGQYLFCYKLIKNRLIWCQ